MPAGQTPTAVLARNAENKVVSTAIALLEETWEATGFTSHHQVLAMAMKLSRDALTMRTVNLVLPALNQQVPPECV